MTLPPRAKANSVEFEYSPSQSIFTKEEPLSGYVSPFPSIYKYNQQNPEEDEWDNETNDTEMLKNISVLLDLGKTYIGINPILDLFEGKSKKLPCP